MITTIEELSLNAWPSHQTLLYDGWVLRFANGYTRRANSVIPLSPSSIDLDEKIAFCEGIYREQMLDVVFKLTPAAFPPNLDESLSARGYRKDASTAVQILDLEAVNLKPDREVELQENLSEGWLDGFCRMNAVGEPRREILRRILLNIVPRHCFVAIRAGDQIVACGLGVLQAGYLGLFDIVTDEALRRRGYGGQIVNSLLAWGKQNGARLSYLQVMLNNPPALHLYSKIGFVEEYQYWYRIKP
jgi:GNAT superfamily N-acetyltransferase